MSNIKIDAADAISLGICSVPYCKLLPDLTGKNRGKKPKTPYMGLHDITKRQLIVGKIQIITQEYHSSSCELRPTCPQPPREGSVVDRAE